MFLENGLFPNISTPQPPRNVFVSYVYSDKTRDIELSNALDIVWDNPSANPFNEPFSIQGVNIYRSYDSQLGPWEKINTAPIVIGFYRDQMTHERLTEDVSNSFDFRGDSPDGQFVFKTQYPLVKDFKELVYANNTEDITLTIDGQPVPVALIRGYDRTVSLIVTEYLDKVTKLRVKPILPKPDSVVLCTYLRNVNNVSLDLGKRIFYKLTTVSDQGESALEHSDPFSSFGIEGWDYIWKEAVRRNGWILKQGGEDCKVFLRKWFGDKCTCFSEMDQRAKERCPSCYGTGIAGGYLGPVKFTMAPVDAQIQLRRGETGLNTSRTGTHWSNVAPRLHTYDIIQRSNGEFLEVGYVQHSEVRGNANLQQEFNASLVQKGRFVYRLPTKPKDDAILVTDKVNIPDGQEVRGRTVTHENITY